MRILFITSNRIGDAVLSNGVLQAMLDQYPGAKVTVAVGQASASLYEAVPGLEEIIAFKKQKYHAHWLRLWGRCAKKRWDVVVDMRGTGISYFLWTRRRLVNSAKDDKVHRIVELSKVLNSVEPPSPVVWTDDSHNQKAVELVPVGSKILAVGPAANWSGKQWPVENFIELIDALTGAEGVLPDARLMVLAAPHEREQIKSVLSALPPDRVIDLIGYDLVTAAACLKRSDLFVGNDSGLMHLAAAAGVKTLGLFGPSPEWRYHPWGVDCACIRTPESYRDIISHPDYDYSHGVDSYMQSLTVENVASAAVALCNRGQENQAEI